MGESADTARERLTAKRITPAQRRRAAKLRQAEEARKRVLHLTGDPSKADKVYDKIAGTRSQSANRIVDLARKAPKPQRDRILNNAAYWADPNTRGKLLKAGFVPPEGGVAGRLVSDLVNAGIMAVPGLVMAAGQVGGDIVSTARGKPTLKRTVGLGKAVGGAVAQDVRHPLRHPGYTLLDALGFAAAGAGVASRAGAAGAAASAARTAGKSPARAALTRPGYEGGSLLRRPQPGIRKLPVGDTTVQGVYSKQPLTRAAQQKLDERLISKAKAGDEGPLARKAARVGERQRLVEEDAARAPIVTQLKAGRRLTLAQKTALRLYQDNTPIDARIALARRELEKTADAKTAKRLKEEIGLLNAARPYLTVDREGRVALARRFATPRRRSGRRGATPQELRMEAARTLKGTRRRETQLVELGLATPERLKAAKDIPARVTAGARFDRKQGRLVGGEVQAGTRPRTLPEADRRIAELDKQIGPEVDKIYGALRAAYPTRATGKPKSEPRIIYPEARGGNLEKVNTSPGEVNPAAVRREEGLSRQGQALPRSRAQAEATDLRRAYELIVKHGTKENAHPSLRRLAEQIEERETLAGLRTQNAAAGIFEEAPAGYGEVAVTKPARGRSYTPYGSKKARGVVYRTFQSRTGARPKPSPEVSGSLKTSTGHNLRTADYQRDVTRAQADANAAVNRLHQSVRVHQRLLAAGRDQRPPDTLRLKWVPVRERTLTPDETRNLQTLAQRVTESPETGLSKTERVEFELALRNLADIRPDLEAAGAPVGASVAGVRWVPKPIFDRVTAAGQPVASVATTATARKVQTAWREFTSLMRGMVLYQSGLGAGYVAPNLSANVLLLAFQGGPKTLAAARQALNPKYRAAVGEDAWHAGLARMGEGFATSTFAQRAGRGPISAFMTKAAEGLGKITDEQTRMVALVHEARERGFRTPQQFRQLMLDPRHADDAMDVTLRARDAALDYALMTPGERATIAQVLFVYPFLRASTRYTLRFPLDHPVMAALLAQLGEIAAGDDDLGPRPPSLEAAVRLPGSRNVPGVGRLPLVTNLNPLSPFSAAPELARTTGSAFGNQEGGDFEPLDALNPAIRAVGTAAVGVDPFTHRQIEGDLLGEGFFGRLIEQTRRQLPISRDVEQWRKTPEQRAKQIIPRTPRDVILRNVFGSVAPRPYNQEAAEEIARREYEAGLPAPVRARRRVRLEQQNFRDIASVVAPEMLHNGKLSPRVRRSFAIEAERQALYAEAAEGERENTQPYHYKRYLADLKLLVRHKQIASAKAARLAAQARTAALEELKTARRQISERYYQAEGGQLYWINEARKYLRDRGGGV